MKTVIFTLILLNSSLAMAGYDFSVGPETIALKSQDGIVIPNALFDYTVFAEHLQIPCSDDGAIVGIGCWKLTTVQSGRLNTGAAGLASLPQTNFHSGSPLDRPRQDGGPLLVSLWSVLTAFEVDGKTYNCATISAYELQQAQIEFSVGTNGMTIQAPMSQISALSDRLVTACAQNVAAGRYLNTPFVLPH